MSKLAHNQIATLQKEQYAKKIAHPVSVVLENIRSLYNIGSMFRTADGAGIDTFYLTGYTAAPPRKEIEKSALGSTETVVWEKEQETLTLIRRLKSEGKQIVVFEHADNSEPYNEIEYSDPTVLVFGNEVRGVSAEVIALADKVVLIPMYGAKQSLNVSVSFGIALYHVIEHFHRDKIEYNRRAFFDK